MSDLIINENYIREIVRHEIKKSLNEMAMPLKIYKDRVSDIIQQLIQNWCLVRYSTISNDKLNLKNHWKTELLSHMSLIHSMKVKPNDNIKIKEKALYTVWNWFEFDINESCIDGCIKGKFKKEKINTNGDIYSQVIDDCKKSTKDIVNALLSPTYNNMFDYVQTI